MVDTEKIQKAFVEEVENLISKFDSKIKFDNDAFETVHVLSDGRICGYIYLMEVNRLPMEWGNAQRRKVRLDYESVLDCVAYTLQKHGVKVFDDNGNLIIVQQHENKSYEETDCPNIHLLYARDGFFGGVHGSNAAIFADGLQGLSSYRYENGKLTCFPDFLFRRSSNPKPEPYDVSEFCKTEEEIIIRGRKIKYHLEKIARES